MFTCLNARTDSMNPVTKHSFITQNGIQSQNQKIRARWTRLIVKWKPGKFRTSTGFEPVTSRFRCDALANRAMKPHTLGAGHLWVLMFPWGMNQRWNDILNGSYMNCGYEINWSYDPSLRNCKNCVHNCEDHSFTWFHIRSSYMIHFIWPCCNCRLCKRTSGFARCGPEQDFRPIVVTVAHSKSADFILLPRVRFSFGQRQQHGLSIAKAGNPQITDFRLFCAFSETKQ